MSRHSPSTPHRPAASGLRTMLLGIVALCIVLPAPAHAFTVIQVTPSIDVAGADSDHEIRFTTEQSFDNGSRIEFTYPAGFDLSAISLGPLTGLGGALHNLTRSGQTLILTRTGFSSNPGPKSVVIDGVVNPLSAASYHITLQSFTGGDISVEGPMDSPDFAIVDPLPDHLILTGAQPSVVAGDYLSLRVQALDATDTPRAPGGDQTLDLLSSSPSGSFHASVGGAVISSALLPADSTGLDLWYRDPSIAASPAVLTVLDVSGSPPTLGFAQTNVQVLAGPLDAVLSSVGASTPVVADGVAYSSVDLVLRDGLGNPVAGVDSSLIALSLPVADLDVEKLQASSDSGGAFAARVRTLQAGDHVLSADVNAVTLNDSPSIHFDVRPVDALQSSLSAGGDALADGLAAIALDLMLRDGLGRAVAGVDSSQIDFVVLDGPVTLTKLPAASDASGAFRVLARSTVAGVRRVTAQVGGVDLADTVSIRFVTGAVDAARSSVVLDGPALADGSAFITADMVLRDAFDNPIADVDSALIALSLLDANVTKLAASSELDGSFRAELRSSVAGLRTLSAVVDGVPLDDAPIAEFTAGAIDALRTSLSALPAQQVADGIQTIALELTLRDAFDNPVAGVDSARVRFDLHPAWQLTLLDAASDGAGRLRAELRSTLSSAASAVARVDGIAVGSPAALEFVAGSLDHFWLVLPDGNTTTAGQLNALRIEARDSQDNRISGYSGTVRLASNTGGPGANLNWSGGGSGTLTPQAPGEADYSFAVADSGGVELQLSDTLAESLLLRVSEGAVQDTIALLVQPAAASQLAVLSGNGQSAVVASPVALPLRVQVSDAFGNGVAGVSVDFVSPDGGRIDADPSLPGDQSSVASDVNGEAACPLWELGTLAGLQSVSASTGFGGSQIFNATALAGPAANLRLEPEGAQNLEVAGSTLVAARATDLYDNAVSGLELTFFVSDALDGVLSGVGETDSLGIAQQRGITAVDGRLRVRYTAPATAGLSDVLDATAAGFPASAVNDLVFTSVVGNAVAIRLELPVPAQRAGLEGSFPLRLVDAFGNDAPAASATVELRSAPATGLEFAASIGGPYSAALDLSVLGAGTVYYRGGPAGLHDFSASDAASLLVGDNGQLEILPSTSVSYFTLSYPASATAGLAFSMQVDAFDAWNNLAVDANESFSFDLVSAADSSIALPVPLAVVNGGLSAGRFVSSAQRIDLAGDYALRLGHAGLGTVGSALRVDAAPAYELVAVGADTLLGITAGDAVDLEVEARDAFGNAVANETLNPLLVEGGSLEFSPPATDALGRALFRLRTASSVGNARLRVGILDGNPITRETALFFVQTQAGAVASLSVQLADTLVVAGDAMALTVRAFDVGGNPALAASDAVDLSVLGSGAVVTPSSGSLLGGVLVASARDTLVGSFRIEASLSAAPSISTQSESARVLPAPAQRITPLGAIVFDAPAGGRSTIASRVEDRFGNAVPGELVRLSISSAPPGASLEDPDPPLDDGLLRSDANGRAEFDLLLSTTTGVHAVRAAILDANPPASETVDWTVTGISGAADHLVIALPSDTLTAGVATPLSIRVEDASGNLVPFDGELALDSTPTGATTVPASILVSGGTAEVSLSVFAAGPLTLDGRLVSQPGVSGSLTALTVLPNLAAGVIPVPLVDPDPNTANGLAVTRLEAGPILDAWNNTVAPGSVVDLVADGGAWISEDMDPARPGLQRHSDASGHVSARLVAPTSPAVVNVDFSSAAASGQAMVQFLAPALLVLAGPSTPSAVLPGQSISFQVPVRNDGEVTAQLSASLSNIAVDDGQGASFVALLAADTMVPAGATVNLDYVSTQLPVDFAPGSHRPSLSLAGQDEHAQAVAAFLVLPQGSLQVGALMVRSVQHVLQAVVGDSVEVRVELENLGGGPVEIVQLALDSSPLGDFQFLDGDPLPTLSPGEVRSLASRWIVGPATSAGSYRFVARVTGRVGGSDFNAPADSSATPLAVSTSSQLELVAGGITPSRIQHGASLSLSVAVRNSGGVTVDLDPAATLVSMGGGLWSAGLSSPVALPPSGEATLLFDALVVPAALGSGDQDLLLHLEGDEAGRAVVVDLSAPAAVLVETPAAIALAPTPLDPALALRGANIAFALALDNAGEASVILDPLTTRLRLGEPGGQRIQTLLDAASPRTLASGGTQLHFQDLALPSDLLLADPVGFVELRGTQNGQPYALDLALPASALGLQDPAGLRILATEALNPRAPSSEVNAGQSISVRVIVGNAGGDAIDSLRVSLRGSASPASRAAEILRPRLAAGATDTLLFDVDLTSTLGPEVLRARIERALSALTGEAVLPEEALDDEASLSVQRPVALAFVAEWPNAADPSSIQVSPGQVFELRVGMERVPPVDSQGDWIGVDVDLSGLGAFTLEPGSSNPVWLSPNAPEATLRLRAPPTNELASLVLALRRTDLDANDPTASPLQTAASQNLIAEVVGGTAFDLCALQISSPAGALDGVLSTGQSFVIQGELDGPSNLQNRALELLLPAQLALVGGSARQGLPAGVTTASWQLQCAAQVASDVTVRVVAHALDVQSSEVLADTCSSLLLQIESATEARPSLSILAPSSARDRGELAPGGIVEFEGAFTILGDAVPTGTAQLRIELPAAFTLLDGASTVQDLSDAAQTVRWRAQGPSQLDLGVQTIRLHTEIAFRDENSGLPAAGASESDAVALSILSDPLRLQLFEIDSGSQLVSSDRIYERVRLTLLNGHGEPSRLTLFELSVVDDAGAAVADPSAILQALQLRRADGSGTWSAPTGANPIRFVLDSAVGGDASADFLIGVQAREGSSGASFALRVETATASILDPSDFPLSYTLLDANGVGRSPIVVGSSVTASSDPEIATHSYPNPFVPSRELATLSYQLEQDSGVEIEIFDLLGERVMQWSFALGTPQSSAGLHDGDVTWDGRNGRGEAVRNGVYLCRFRAEGREILFRIAVTR